jgi:amino acid adenylation domain-containing protein
MIQLAIQHKLKHISEKFESRTAIEIGQHRLTYGDLEKRINLIARQLLHRGVQKQTFVGIFMENRVGIIAAMLGILRAGCVFVPLDSAHPGKRLEQMIRVTGIRLVICDTLHLERLETLDVVKQQPMECLLLEELLAPREFPGDQTLPDVTFSPEDKIYIYFTSGTTGEPRAVLGKNKSLLHFIDWEISAFGIDETFRFSQFTTPGFDVFLRDIFVPLSAGATICIPESKEIIIDGRQLTAWLNEKAINLSHCVPSLFRLIHTGNDLGKDHFKYLKYVLLAGEKIIPGELKNWYRIFGSRIQLVNVYGPTETTLAKLFYLIQPSDTEREIMPVGKPIKGARVIILDEKMEICDELIAGELYIRTPYRSFGYYNDPQLNKGRFIQNPFNQNPDDIIYKTGDLARLLPDGNIELLGRIDRQVKIRGMRVELEEIESVMVKHPSIKEAVVIKHEMSNHITLLLAGITLVESETNREQETSIIEQVKDHLARHLPDYMIPAQINVLETIPRKPNGKVDYNELPALLQYRETDAVPPQNNIEEKLLDIWTQTLGTPPPGVTHSFFELGGNSLNMMTLISRIHRELDVRITLAEAFDNPTIRTQAQLLQNAVEDEYSAIEPAELKEYYPLSPAQKRLYIIQQMDVKSTSYNMPGVIIPDFDIDREKLEQTFYKLIQRHESLRTSFSMLEGEPVQKMHSEVEFRTAVYDLTRIPVEAEEGTDGTSSTIYPGFCAVRCADTIKNFIRPFDLSRAPLVRAGIIETVEKKYLLLVDIHHIVSDGISLDILERDFKALYEGEESPPLRLQYRDYVQWQNNKKVKESVKKQEQYWLSQFEDRIPVLDLPTDFPRPQVQDFSGSIAGFKIAEKEIDTLKHTAQHQDATLFMVLLAVYTIFLSKISRQEDIVVGTAAAGRRHADLEQIIGMFVNTLPLRNHPKADKSFTEFLDSVKERTLHAFENQDYPFEDLVERLRVTRDTSRNPLFDTMFDLNHLEVSESSELPEIKNQSPEPYPYDMQADTAKFDLILTATDTGENLWFSLQYCTRLFKTETIERFITYFKQVVSFVCTLPSVLISEIEIISPQEKEEVLYTFNKTEMEYPRTKTIDQLFEEQAERAGDHIAVIGIGHGVQGMVSLTYNKLEKKSNQLSWVLREKGVQPDNVVGLMVDHSIEMIIGILGILKSGGAYLPLDPTYPKERINFMLKDSNAGILLKSEIRSTKSVATLRSSSLRSTRTNPNDKNSNDQNVGVTSIVLNFEHLNFEFVSNFEFRVSNLSSSNLAYVIYTSGSTGKPKGVLVEHRNVVANLYAFLKEFKITPQDTMIQLSSYTFDAFIEEVFPLLVSGGKIAIPPERDIMDMEEIALFIQQYQVTIIDCTPLLLNEFNKLNPSDLASVRFFISGGDVLKPEYVDRLAKRGTLYNTYGPTETTVCASYHKCPEDFQSNVPIGKPISNYHIYILDNRNRLLPIGAAGELCISGAGVSRGYLNNPELTADKFREVQDNIPGGTGKQDGLDPLLERAPLIGRLYHTGDMARWVPDGNVEFLGRMDYQVKIRGFRVELGEIEKQLVKHHDIKETAVIDRESDGGHKYLCAYIVSDRQLSVSQLRGYLTDQLPDFMIPEYFIEVDKIPLNPNGKVDRKTLESYGTRIDTGVEYMEPVTENEKIITNIWKEVLGVDKVGIHDNFFEIGGNSLKIIQVNQKLKEAFKKEIPVVKLFQYTTVSSIARSLDGQEAGDLFSDYGHQVQEKIKKGKETRKQRHQKRRGGII